MSPGKRDLVRYREVRRADALDDQKSALAIQAANTALTQEALQELVLSQLKRVIWGSRAGHWNDDFIASNIPALADISLITPVFDATCDPADSVGMYVRVCGPAVGGVRQVTRVDIFNRATMPAVGVIIEKASSTQCKVRSLGEVGVAITMVPGKRYFVGADSRLTATPPAPSVGEIIVAQIIGVALDSGTLFVNPNLNYIVQVGG